LDSELTKHLDQVAERIINEALHSDTSEAEEVNLLPQGEPTDGITSA